MDGKKEIKTLCGMCPWGCGIIAELEGDRVVKIKGDPDHPWNHGRLCPKGASILDHVFSPDRIKYPMKKVKGKFERISWDEALNIMATELLKIKEEYGAKSWAVMEGMSFVTQGGTSMGTLQRFCDVYGSPNFFSPESYCYLSRITAGMLTLGKFPNDDPENSSCIILWGHNPSDSNFIKAEQIQGAVKRGAKLIVVDPRRTPLAKKAHLHAQIRPGTDSAFALSLMNVIIEEGLYDKEFVDQYTSGFAELAEHVKSYAPEATERITWIPAGIVREIARIYASIKPATIVEGINSLGQCTSGFQNYRATLILQSLTGNIDKIGGTVNVDLGGPELAVANYAPIRVPERVHDKPMGGDEFPVLVQGWTAQGLLMADMVLTGEPYPIKGLTIVGSNPLLTWPNANKVKQALEEVEFLSVITVAMNETAEMADLVLPAASFLERTEVWEILSLSFSMPYITLRNKVLDFYESRPDAEIWFDLARRMGYEEYFPWKSMEELIKRQFEPTFFPIGDYLGKTNCIPYGRMKYKQYETEGFKTPSGKVEISSIILKQLGLSPLPVFQEPPESPLSTPDLAREYPVILTTGARNMHYTHSSFHELPAFRKRMAEPYGEIHPETAARYGIVNGGLMIVATRQGAIEIKARVTEDILPQVLNITHGWSESNVNILTDDRTIDPVTGYPSLKALLCRVSPKAVI